MFKEIFTGLDIKETCRENGLIVACLELLTYIIVVLFFVLLFLPFLPFYYLNEKSKELFKGEENDEET